MVNAPQQRLSRNLANISSRNSAHRCPIVLPDRTIGFQFKPARHCDGLARRDHGEAFQFDARIRKISRYRKNRSQKFMTIDVNEALKALANPTRLAILNWLKDPRTVFPEQEVDPETVGVCVSIIQERTGLSQSTTSLYLAALQRAQLVTSQRIGPGPTTNATMRISMPSSRRCKKESRAAHPCISD